MADNTSTDKLSTSVLQDKINRTLDNQYLWDVGVSINRTMAVPLDLSAIAFPETQEENGKKVEADHGDTAEQTVNDSTISYPGQVFAVVGSTDATPFVVQPAGHTRKVTTLDEDSVATTEDIPTNVEQLAYKSYVDEQNTDLKRTIGTLSHITNFRGAFPTFTAAYEDSTYSNVAIEKGDIIIITGDPESETGADNTYKDGKPGMEYVCVDVEPVYENGKFIANKPTWQELGFGSQLTAFINGNTGLILPDKQTIGNLDHEEKDLLGYLTESDRSLAKFVGTNAAPGKNGEQPELTLPGVTPWNETTVSKTVLEYIQESDKVITGHIGTADTKGKQFALPQEVPFENAADIPTKYQSPKTVLDYIQTADQSIKVKLEGILDAERAARRTTDTDIATFIGTDITIEETLGDNEGDTGTSLQRPTKYFDTTTDADLKKNTVFGYIQKSDTMLADLIGAKTSSNVQDASLPDGTKTVDNSTVLKFIQNSDKVITDFIGTEAKEGTFSLPEKLPDTTTPREEAVDTVLDYIQAADKNLADIIGINKEIISTDRSIEKTHFSLTEGESIAEQLSISNNMINELVDFVGYVPDPNGSIPSIDDQLTFIENITEKASDCLKFTALNYSGVEITNPKTECLVCGILDSASDAIIHIPRKDPKGRLVIGIADQAFQNNTNLQKITLPDTITHIGSSAFAGCKSLTQIHLPEGLSQIGTYAFSFSGLEEIYIPKTCRQVHSYVFQGCESLKQAIFDPDIKGLSMSSGIFKDCKALKLVEFPTSCETILNHAFENCESLTTLLIRENLALISSNAFSGCTQLSKIYYTGTNATWDQIDIRVDSGLPESVQIIYNVAPEKYSINNKIDQTNTELYDYINDLAIRSPKIIEETQILQPVVINDLTNNKALSDYSFAGGIGTIAKETQGQFVIGTYNDPDFIAPETSPEAEPLFIVGNGSADNQRSNAVVVRTDGITELKGLKVHGDVEYHGHLAFDRLKARSVVSDSLKITGDIEADQINLTAKAFTADSAEFNEVKAPTLNVDTNDTNVATTAFVHSVVEQFKTYLQQSKAVEITSLQIVLEGGIPLNTSTIQLVNPSIQRFQIQFITSEQIKLDNIQSWYKGTSISTNWTLSDKSTEGNYIYYTRAIINAAIFETCGNHTLKITVSNILGTQESSKSVTVKVGRPVYYGSILEGSIDDPARADFITPYDYTSNTLVSSHGFTKVLQLSGERKSSSGLNSYSIKENSTFCYLVPYAVDGNNKVTFALPDPSTDFDSGIGALRMRTRLVHVDGEPYVLYYPGQNPGTSLKVNISASIINKVFTFN